MRGKQQPTNMSNIMRLLVITPYRYDDGMYISHPRFIVVKKGVPAWKDQPPPPEVNSQAAYYYQLDWPKISKDCFRRILKKGWLQEIKKGVYGASDLGEQEYLSVRRRQYRLIGGRSRPLSKYRIKKQKAAMRRALREERRNNPEPEPKPLRQEKKRGKFRHDGYRRHANKLRLDDGE